MAGPLREGGGGEIKIRVNHPSPTWDDPHLPFSSFYSSRVGFTKDFKKEENFCNSVNQQELHEVWKFSIDVYYNITQLNEFHTHAHSNHFITFLCTKHVFSLLYLPQSLFAEVYNILLECNDLTSLCYFKDKLSNNYFFDVDLLELKSSI